MKRKIIGIIIIGWALIACNFFQNEKKDNTLRNLGILSIINNNRATTSTSSCSGSSGAVICIPQGIAE